jgi:tetratricopeptide (TPR) repeat protein
MRSYLALARIYLSEKKQDKAIEQYQKIIEKNPKQAGAHMMLGMIYEYQKKNDLSEDHYRKALVINPDFVPAANNLAYMLAEKGGNLDEALEFAKKAKEKAPEEGNIMDTLGWVYYKKGLYESAISEFLDCVEKMPDNPIVYYHLGLAYYKNGNIEKARAQLEKSLKISKTYPGADDAKKMLSTL